VLFRFTSPTLPRLDELELEVLIAGVPSDVRPCRGVVGLLDFRMGARLSRLLEAERITGEWGEVAMVPGKPFCSFDKLLLFGMGPSSSWSPEAYAELLVSMVERLAKLRVRVAAVELPGRPYAVISPQAAAEVLIREVGHSAECDQWVLVDDGEGRAVIEALLFEQRRRMRRDPAQL
jgi:hypothetical protein